MIVIRRIREVLSINPVVERRPVEPPAPAPEVPPPIYSASVHAFADQPLAGDVPCDVFPLWHPAGECPATFLCPTPKEA